MKAGKDEAQAIDVLNKALAGELRAALMYAHYAAYLTGRDRLDFEDHFNEESAESMAHAKILRQIIADLGGEAVRAPDKTPIVHTQHIDRMLEEALKTEEAAANIYREVLPFIDHQATWHHDLWHILLAEERSQIELKRLMK